MKEICRQDSLATNFSRVKAEQLEVIVKEIFSTLESAKAKIPAAIPIIVDTV